MDFPCRIDGKELMFLQVFLLALMEGCGSNKVPVITEPVVVKAEPKFDQEKFDKLVSEYKGLVAKQNNQRVELEEAMWEKIKLRHPDWSSDKLVVQIKFLEWKHDSANLSELGEYIASLKSFGSRLALVSDATGIEYPSELANDDYRDRYERWMTQPDPEITKRKLALESQIHDMKYDYVLPY